MKHSIPLVLLFAAALFAGPDADAWGEGRARRKADQWIGRDASELLLALRVDGGRVEIEEDEASGETRYIFRTWNDAYYTTVVTGTDSRMIGIDRGTPIFHEDVHTKQVYVPPSHRCTIVFTADIEGIVRDWRYEGEVCAQDIARPKDRD